MEFSMVCGDWYMETIRCPCCNQRLMDVKSPQRRHLRIGIYHKIGRYDAELFCHRCGTFIGLDR